MEKFTSVDAYIESKEEWQDILAAIRELLIEADLEETLKWSMPAYIWNGHNIIGLCSYKNCVSLWFHHGNFLTDADKVLVNAQEGKTKGMRQWRFKTMKDVNKELILQYVFEAMENSDQGKRVLPQKKGAIIIPPLLADAFKADPGLKAQFETFATFKKREFTEHIASAKRDATKENRLKKIIPMIMEGVGLGDKYRKK